MKILNLKSNLLIINEKTAKPDLAQIYCGFLAVDLDSLGIFKVFFSAGHNLSNTLYQTTLPWQYENFDSSEGLWRIDINSVHTAITNLFLLYIYPTPPRKEGCVTSSIFEAKFNEFEFSVFLFSYMKA